MADKTQGDTYTDMGKEAYFVASMRYKQDNIEEALKVAKDGAETWGNTDCMQLVALIYLKSTPPTGPELELAVPWLLKAYENGKKDVNDGNWMNSMISLLAMAYYEGNKGIPKNWAKAREWARKGISLGESGLQALLDAMDGSSSSTSTPARTYSRPTPLGLKIFGWAVLFAIAIGALTFFFGQTAWYNNIVSNVTGIFSENSISEKAAMQVIRATYYLEAEENGKAISASNVERNKAAFMDYVENPDSYRINGVMRYDNNYRSYVAGKAIATEIALSYNAELNVCRIDLRTVDFRGHEPRKDEQLSRFFIPNGTYYIVEEGGVTYTLSEVGGVRSIADAATASFLERYLMDSIIITDLFSGTEIIDAEDKIVNADYRDGEFYYWRLSNADYNMGFVSSDLKFYKGKPVMYKLTYDIMDGDVTIGIDVNFHYDKILEDAPSVAEWE